MGDITIFLYLPDFSKTGAIWLITICVKFYNGGRMVDAPPRLSQDGRAYQVYHE